MERVQKYLNVILESLMVLVPQRDRMQLDWRRFLGENITYSGWIMAWLAILTWITFTYTGSQLQAAPTGTIVVLLLWILTVSMTMMADIQKRHTDWTLWMKDNLYNSITNVQISLLLTLLIFAGARGFYSYAYTNASFADAVPPAEREYETTVEAISEAGGPNLARMPANLEFVSPAESLTNRAGTVIRETAYILNEDKSVVTVENRDIHTGATWGAVTNNFSNLLIFRYKQPNLVWRVYAVLAFIAVFGVTSIFIFRSERWRNSNLLSALTLFWIISPILIYQFLLGYGQGEAFGRVSPDNTLGGFLFSVMLALMAIVISFPLGVLLALGRRSEVRGIPWWITYPVALFGMVVLLFTNTPTLLEGARSNVGILLAYWPVLIPVLAYLFQRTWEGNVVAAFSTIFIEVWRGIPFITVLFMSIILFPIFLPDGWEVLNMTRVVAGSALFSAAYLAENVRGGLQAIPRGQYEAADSLGLSNFTKYRLIILPQAIRLVIPAIVGQFIGLFKDTSLVSLVGLFDLLLVANTISSQPDWLGVRTEPYIFLLALYFVCSSAMALYSRRLERQLGVGQR